MNKKHNINLDIIRCLALLLVMSVHLGTHAITMNSKQAFIFMLIETISMSCVPLFIILTGFLTSNHKIKLTDKKYYSRLITRILIPYLIVGIVVVLFKRFYLGENIGFLSGLFYILSFPEYFWYINMYIGLFLLTPVLNIIWNNINSKKDSKVLIGILVFLTIAPSFTNIYNFLSPEWWGDLSLSENYNQILPHWWIMLYPITYYFIGAYINRYQNDIKRIKWQKIALVLVGTSILFALYNFWRSHGSTLVLGQWFEYYGFEHSTTAVLIFCMILSMNFSRIKEAPRKWIMRLSELSFGAYMTSWLVDNFLHPKFNEIAPANNLSRLKYVPIMLFITFFSSMFLSWILEIISKFITNKIESK